MKKQVEIRKKIFSDMGKKGAEALLKSHGGSDYMRKLARKRWRKHPEQRSEAHKIKVAARKK